MDFRYSEKNNCNTFVNDLPKFDLQTSKCLGDFSEQENKTSSLYALTEVTV